ncbi:MAG: 3'(2'),5'-bisphosphate nucleotidase [Thermodesulfobacteriota bacterium]
MRFQKELDTALEAVQKAGILCRKAQQTLVTAETVEKKDRSPVTIADFGSQAVITRFLKQNFPQDAVVGEESAKVLRENGALRERVFDLARKAVNLKDENRLLDLIDAGAEAVDYKSRFWTIDPIDGTKGFLRKDQYAVALALVENGKVVLGILGCPAFPANQAREPGAIFYAVRGEGAFRKSLGGGDPVSISTDQNSRPEAVRFCESVESAHAAHDVHAQISGKLGITAPPFRMDSQAKYAAVASGMASIYLRLPRSESYREKIWDHAAGAVIVTEAGGRVTDFSGAPLGFSAGRTLVDNVGIVATNGPLHDRVLEAIQAVRSGG